MGYSHVQSVLSNVDSKQGILDFVILIFESLGGDHFLLAEDFIHQKKNKTELKICL